MSETTSDVTTELVHLDVSDGIAHITLDSPDNRNAISGRLRADLLRHLVDACADDTVRVVVLCHTGPVFCAGADLKESRTADPELASRDMAEILRIVMESDKPVVAQLAGPARAGGIGLVAACDFAVAIAEATFAFTEVRIGVVPSMISVPLHQRVSTGVLRRLFLTGEVFDANHAAQIGLVSTVSSVDRLTDDVADVVAQLRRGSPAALAAVKHLTRPASAVLEHEFEQMRELSASFFASADAVEGRAAFAERRPPAWAPETPSTTVHPQQGGASAPRGADR